MTVLLLVVNWKDPARLKESRGVEWSSRMSSLGRGSESIDRRQYEYLSHATQRLDLRHASSSYTSHRERMPQQFAEPSSRRPVISQTKASPAHPSSINIGHQISKLELQAGLDQIRGVLIPAIEARTVWMRPWYEQYNAEAASCSLHYSGFGCLILLEPE